jgi:SAM-dependent methyltransferase
MFGCNLGDPPMSETCDLCQSSALEPIHEPTASIRGLTVYLCSDCGLVQSLPRADRTARHTLAVSSGADRRHARYSKTLRSEACLSLIRAHADLDSSLLVLDVGSDRGSFARTMLAAASETLLTCVERNKHMSDAYAGLARTELLGENTRLIDASFDIVHSYGALEQSISPASTLADHWRVLRPGGLLIVDVSNIALIDSDEIVEEWFIDNHLYHFSRVTLARFLEAGGFEIVARPDPKDRENLLFAARKRIRPTRSVARDPAEVDAALALITSYVTARAQRAA